MKLEITFQENWATSLKLIFLFKCNKLVFMFKQPNREVGTEVALEFLVQLSTVRIFKKILNLEHTF